MRRNAGILAVVAGLALLVGGLSFASAAQSSMTKAKPRVLHAISRATAINNLVDTGPAGFSPGDLYVFSERLFLANAPNEQVGTADGRCLLIDPAAARFDCSITSKLPDGEIMTAGTLTLVEGTTSVAAVVGGTGGYRSVRGEASVHLGPFEGPHEVTYELILQS